MRVHVHVRETLSQTRSQHASSLPPAPSLVLEAEGMSRPEKTVTLLLTSSLCELLRRFLSDQLTRFKTGTPVIW